jgi:predicted RNA-binding protein YlqC (UPF0109 family)
MTIPELISDICRAIAGHEFRLAVAQGEHTMLIEVFAKPEHAGSLIGAHGATALALQQVAWLAGRREGLRVILRVEVE